jgi:hypothetical protein
VTGDAHRRTEVAVPCPARDALAARFCRVDGDPLARPRSVLDDADELVPEDERSIEARRADRRLLEPVQVRAAQPDRGGPQA